MDQLEILKKDWKKQEGTLPKLSKDELTKLIHKKSSSIVKWIFIISVLEFVLPFVIVFLTGNEKTSINQFEEEFELTNISLVFYWIYYVVLVGFIFLFYRNYKSISANDNPKTLMFNIIKTRQTVKYYIWFNLMLIPIASIIMLYKVFSSEMFLGKVSEDTNLTIIWIISIILIAIFVVLVWLFYRLIYGILLNKLKVNYNELMSNEINEL